MDIWEPVAAAVIAHHEAAQWRPMSEQDEVPTRALLAYEVARTWTPPPA
jgi:hypothetical protein